MCVVVDEAGHLSMVAADKSREAARLVTEAADKNRKISTALLCKAKKTAWLRGAGLRSSQK